MAIANSVLGVAAAAQTIDRLEIPVIVDGPIKLEELSPHLGYYLDPRWDADLQGLSGNPSAFAPLMQQQPDFGYTKSRVWLRFHIVNATETNSEWRLHLHENFKQIMDVWIVSPSGEADNVLSLRRDSPFSARPVSHPEMVAPFMLDPGAEATIYIAYWSEGSSQLAISIETRQSFADLTIAQVSKNFVFYGMVMVCIIAALLGWAIMRKSVFAAFVAYCGMTLLFLLHADGVAFQYMWPNAPLFNSIASAVTGGAFMVSAANYARVFLQMHGRSAPINRLLLIVTAIATLTTLSVFVLDPQVVKKMMIPAALLVILTCIGAGIYVARTNLKGVRLFLLAWFGAAISSVIMNLRHLVGIEISQDVVFDSMRIAIVLDAILMGLAIVDQFSQMRHSRQDDMRKSLREAKRNLELTTRLGEVEQRYVLVTELAKAHSAKVADTIHDLRQPLHALRHQVTSLASAPEADDAEAERVNETFAYLEELLASELQGALTIENRVARQSEAHPSVGPGIQEMLQSVHDMFIDDARVKGLELRLFKGTAEAQVDPLVLMRITSNLVSNAIKYTDAGKILIGTRRLGGKVRIEVHDTGRGLSEDEFSSACQRAVRLDRDKAVPRGNGLGLAIACDLAKQHGFELRRLPLRNNGTSICVEIL